MLNARRVVRPSVCHNSRLINRAKVEEETPAIDTLTRAIAILEKETEGEVTKNSQHQNCFAGTIFCFRLVS